MLITDDIDWSEEYEHLLILQEKVNNYIAFCESGQYRQNYDVEITHAIIEIHFKFDITENAEKFLNQVQNQISELGILIECYIDKE